MSGTTPVASTAATAPAEPADSSPTTASSPEPEATGDVAPSAAAGASNPAGQARSGCDYSEDSASGASPSPSDDERAHGGPTSEPGTLAVAAVPGDVTAAPSPTEGGSAAVGATSPEEGASIGGGDAGQPPRPPAAPSAAPRPPVAPLTASASSRPSSRVPPTPPPRRRSTSMPAPAGWADDLRERERREARQEAKRARVEADTRTWRRTVLPQWAARRTSKQVRQLCFRGIPPAIRGDAWPVMIGNPLHVTPELYNIFREHARSLRDTMTRLREAEDESLRREAEELARAREAEAKAEAGSGAGPTVETDAEAEAGGDSEGGRSGDADATAGAGAGAGAGTGGGGGASSAGGRSESGAGEGAGHSPPLDGPRAQSRSVLGREGSLTLIDADLPRTFPELAFFHGEGPYAGPLRRVLEAYVCYRPDIGYVQGMSFLAANFLLQMDETTSFQCLSNLLSTHFYFDLFRLDMKRLNKHMRVFSAMFAKHLPALFWHFEGLDIEPQTYLLDWLLTLFSKSLRLDIACRVWDSYFVEGQLFIWKTALGILNLLEPQLLEMGFGMCLRTLQRLPEDLDEEELFACIASVKMTQKKFDALLAKPDPLAKALARGPPSHGGGGMAGRLKRMFNL